MTIAVICWKWKPNKPYRSYFDSNAVNTLKSMVTRHLTLPHKFFCITDDSTGLDSSINVVDLWDGKDVKNVYRNGPDCTRRLRLFDPDFVRSFGCDKIVSLDLDCVITGSLDPLWDRDEPFMMWGDTNPRNYYNGSMLMLKPGMYPEVWRDFDPETSLKAAHQKGFFGSDQAWISYKVGEGRPIWGTNDGVYSFRIHFVLSRMWELPSNCRIVFFHGRFDPWEDKIRYSYKWIEANWR